MGGKHYRADFAPLGGADLRLVPCPVVAHTAPHRDGLLLEVNVLPCEGADLADPKPGIVGDLNGQERRVMTEDAKTEKYTAGSPCGAYIGTPCKFEACRASI